MKRERTLFFVYFGRSGKSLFLPGKKKMINDIRLWDCSLEVVEFDSHLLASFEVIYERIVCLFGFYWVFLG